MALRHLLVSQIRRMMFNGELPQNLIFIVLRFPRGHSDKLAIYLQTRLWVFLQIQIQIGIFILPPIGRHDQVATLVIQISDRNCALLSGIAPNRMQDEDFLCAKFASEPSMTDADEEGVKGHEPFDENVIHLIFFYPGIEQAIECGSNPMEGVMPPRERKAGLPRRGSEGCDVESCQRPNPHLGARSLPILQAKPALACPNTFTSSAAGGVSSRYNLSKSWGSTSGTLFKISMNFSRLPRFVRFSKY